MVIRSFEALQAAMVTRPAMRLAVAGAEEPSVIAGVVAGFAAGLLAQAVLTGRAEAIAPQIPADLASRIRILPAASAA